MDNFSSSSGDMSESGFNDFMNDSESSSDYMPVSRNNKKTAGRPNTGDPYAYDIDFGDIKIPSKVQAKPAPKPAAKKPQARAKSPDDSDDTPSARPKTTGSKFGEIHKEFNKMLKNVKKESSDESESGSSNSMHSRPKLQEWGNAKKDYLPSSYDDDDSSESNKKFKIKTEPFTAKVNQPISLNKKLDIPKDPAKDQKFGRDNQKGFFRDPDEGKRIGGFSPLESDFLSSSEMDSEDKMYSKEDESSSKNPDKESEMYSGGSQDAESKDIFAKARKAMNMSSEVEEESEGSEEDSDIDSEDQYSLTQSQIERKEEKPSGGFSDYLNRPPDKTPSSKPKDSKGTSEIYTEKTSEKASEKHSEIYSEDQSEKYTETYSEKFEEYESHHFSGKEPGFSQGKTAEFGSQIQNRPGKVGESVFKLKEIEEYPMEDDSKRIGTPNAFANDAKPPVSKQYRPQTTNDRLYTRERELEIEIVDLRKTVQDMELELQNKQEQVYFLERKEKQANFAKIEYEALEKVKTQLREAYHKIELYKVETEELIKQVDYTEARVKDLEAENLILKSDLDRKDKNVDERIKTAESRTSERMIKELTRQFELDREDLLRSKKDLEIESNRIKSDLLRLEGENRDLRNKIWTLRDQEEKIKDLQQENYILSQKNPQEVVSEASKEPINEALQKEIHLQENLIHGFQKENEKLMSEIRALKNQIKEERLKAQQEGKKFDQLKTNLISEHGGVLIKENVSDLGNFSSLAGGTIINKEEFLNLKENLARMTKEIMEKEKNFREKELQMCENIEKLKKYKFEAEFVINSFQTSQEFVSRKAIDMERQEMIRKYEQEIQDLKDKLDNAESWQQTGQENMRIKFLEDHCRSLEEALKQKEPISALIKAVKPEGPDQSTLYIKKIAELEELLRKKSFDYDELARRKMGESAGKMPVKRPKDVKNLPKAAVRPTVKTSDPMLVDKIRELEKHLEDTKNYYISKLNSMRPDTSEEVKHLREQVGNYEKIIQSIKSGTKTDFPSLFPFLSSFSGSIWCQICQEVSFLSPNITQKNSKELVSILSKIIEVLETNSASPSFACFASFDKILDKTLALSSLLKGIPNWNQVEKVYNELCNIIEIELSTACRGSNNQVSEKDEEYWSDFSDNDQEQEDHELIESMQVLSQIKEGVGYLNRIGGGWLSLAQVQEILISNIPDLSTINVQSLLRRFKSQGGKLNIDSFLHDLAENPIQWWEQKLKDYTWELRNQISSKGNFQSIVDKQILPWVIDCVLEKIENYVTREGIDYEMLTEQLFSGSLTISKRNFRKKVLEHKLPLTREECHIIIRELDRSKMGQITAKVFLNFIKKSPKAAWVPPKAEEFPEYKQLSERDAQFLLIQANKRIHELEAMQSKEDKKPNLSVDHTLALKLRTAEEETESVKSKLAYVFAENEKLRIDKQRLEAHISKQPVSVGASEYLALQRKLESIEENHYRREQELKSRMSGLSFRTEKELDEMRRKHETEKSMMQKIIVKKTEEINEFKVELEELLNEIELLRAKRKK